MNIRDRNPLLLGIVALCALGVGVTGTMLWMKEGAPSSPSTAVAVVTPTPPVAAPEASPSLPSATQVSNAQAALTRGNAFYDNEQWARAIEQYKLVIAGGFDNPDVRTDMGNALRFGGEPQLALEQYKIAQSQDPNHEQSLFNQGGLWTFALHNPSKGVQAWRAYLKKFPQGHSAEEARAFIRQHQPK